MSGKGPDWGKTGTIVAMAEWLRKNSGALAVVVIRRDDAALAADPAMPPADVRRLVEDYTPRLAGDLERARREARAGGRLEMEPISE